MKKWLRRFLLIVSPIIAVAYYFGLASCQDQVEYYYSPYCLRCNIQDATAGDAGAMYNLAIYYEGKDPEQSKSWWRKSVQQGGDKRAITSALSDCGPGKAFTKHEAEDALLKSLDQPDNGMSMYAMNFYLGGYCGEVNITRARHYFSLDSRDDLILCRVALKYGEIVKSVSNDPIDKKNAIYLLLECVAKTNPAGETYRRAKGILDTLHFDQTGPGSN